MPDPKLIVERVSKSFHITRPQPMRIQALAETSLHVDTGEIVALIGSSGCGKTTLLKIIHGLIPADGGAITIGGHRVHGPGHDRGMVFQHAGLLPWRTAAGNVEFGLEMKKVPTAQRREIAMRYLELVGLQGFEHHHPHQLSGGMRQRVGLARALAIDPEVLLMDEPFGALDAQTKEQMQLELLRIQAATGKTVLFVTHDLDEAVFLAERVIVLAPRPGRVIEEVRINLPRPRLEPAETKGTREFIEARTHIWHCLRDAAADALYPSELSA